MVITFLYLLLCYFSESTSIDYKILAATIIIDICIVLTNMLREYLEYKKEKK